MAAPHHQEIEAERSEFIPFAAHFDAETVLSKNGELCQIFKIEGYQFDTRSGEQKVDLRKALREAYSASALEPHFCLTVHIVRRRRDLNPSRRPEGFFASGLDKAVNEKHRWSHSYSNDLYVTLTHEGADFNIANPARFARSFFFLPEKMAQRKKLEAAREKLAAAVNQMMQLLSHFKPRKLQVVEEGGVFYSEPMGLFHYLLNLEAGKKVPMPVSGLDDALITYPLEMAFNHFAVRQPQGNVRLASIYSVKQYTEQTAAALDQFLQYPGEVVVTQQIKLGANQDFIQKLREKAHMAELGEDKEFLRFSGLEDLLSSDKGKWTDFSYQQSTLMIIADSEEKLEEMSNRFMAAVGTIGMVVVREDVMLEDTYYAQLPANALFERRKLPINTTRVAGYATLYDFPTGKLEGNPWGPALSVLKTRQGNPYFFSFHQGKSGHTLIAGPYGCGKTRLLNFLLAQAERVAPRVVWFDTQRSAEMLIRALGGSYLQLVRNREAPRRPLNPLRLPDTPENRVFLEEWLKLLLVDLEGQMPEEPGVDFRAVIDRLYQMAPEKRRLSELQLALPETLAANFAQWLGKGRYGHVFDNAQDELFTAARIHGFDVTELVQDRRPQWAVLHYLMHAMLSQLDGTPTIVVFDEAWTLFDNAVFRHQVEGWLAALAQKNTVAIFATENLDGIPLSPLTERIRSAFATRFLFTDPDVTDSFRELMQLSEAQFTQYKSLRKDREVFLQQGAESVLVQTELPATHGLRDILGGQAKYVTRMENIIAKTGPQPEAWLPAFNEG